MRQALLFFFTSLIVYCAMNYGGIRSPDCEIVFRVGESLASGRGFQVQSELETWKGFGVSKGKDGKLYDIFGPLESIFAVPLIKVADLVNKTGWYENAGWLPLSHYTSQGLMDFIRGRSSENPEAHALRFIVSFLNALLTAVSTVLFWFIACKLVSSRIAAGLSTVLFSFGTLVWPYAETFFSEPLSCMLSLLSFYLLLRSDPSFRGDKTPPPYWLFLSGLSLGLSTAAHITGILFAPFFFAYAWFMDRGRRPADKGRKGSKSASRPAHFLIGLGLILFFLGIFNYTRFGSFFETGRSVGGGNFWSSSYSHFIYPWRSFWALLFSSGKGLFIFSPALLAGLLGWRYLHRRSKLLSYVLASAVLFRILFIASRSDWHGGFSLGPRYLITIVPFFLVPVPFWVEKQIKKKKIERIGFFILFTFVCASEQLYFSLGEIFSFYHLTKWKYGSQHINIFFKDRLYTDWSLSPLLHLSSGRTAPFWLHGGSLGVQASWLIGSVILAIIGLLGFYYVSRQITGRARAGKTKE